MRPWPFAIAAAVLLLTGPLAAQEQQAGQTQPPAANPWQPARLPDGQPDVQGLWNPVIGGGFSLTNPRTGAADFEERAGGRAVRNPSRIVDPPDGKVPYQPWAAALQGQQADNFERPSRPEHIDTQNLCLLNGAPRLYYLPTFRIIQTPGSVVFVWDDYHAYRVIPLDGRPHLGSNIRLWMGDGRGHWENNTLVIDTTNLNGKPRLSVAGDFFSDKAHLEERFTFIDASR